MKKQLCCSVNPVEGCQHCKKKFCVAHAINTTTTWNTPKKFSCIDCYDKIDRKPFYTKKRKGMSFKTLYRKARKLFPKGYLSVQVDLQESDPGQGFPTLSWTIYNAQEGEIPAGSSKGETPESALSQLETKVNKELPSVENIDV